MTIIVLESFVISTETIVVAMKGVIQILQLAKLLTKIMMEQLNVIYFFLHIQKPSPKGEEVVRGYDFLVNAVWPEIANSLETRTSSIFAPGNPNTFHEVTNV